MYSRLARLEGRDLGILLGEGADQARAGEVLLRLGGDVGEHGLDALEAAVDALPEGLHQHGRQRQRADCAKRQLETVVDHERQGAQVKNRQFALYMMAGPSSCRTAFRSLVVRAMMSPVRWVW